MSSAAFPRRCGVPVVAPSVRSQALPSLEAALSSEDSDTRLPGLKSQLGASSQSLGWLLCILGRRASSLRLLRRQLHALGMVLTVFVLHKPGCSH